MFAIKNEAIFIINPERFYLVSFIFIFFFVVLPKGH